MLACSSGAASSPGSAFRSAWHTACRGGFYCCDDDRLLSRARCGRASLHSPAYRDRRTEMHCGKAFHTRSRQAPLPVIWYHRRGGRAAGVGILAPHLIRFARSKQCRSRQHVFQSTRYSLPRTSKRNGRSELFTVSCPQCSRTLLTFVCLFTAGRSRGPQARHRAGVPRAVHARVERVRALQGQDKAEGLRQLRGVGIRLLEVCRQMRKWALQLQLFPTVLVLCFGTVSSVGNASRTTAICSIVVHLRSHRRPHQRSSRSSSKPGCWRSMLPTLLAIKCI